MPTEVSVVVARRLRIRGVVQGVGFRPFVYRLAQRLGLRGRVRNDRDGVLIQAEGEAAALQCFERLLREEAPPAALVSGVESSADEPIGADRFAIVASGLEEGAGQTRVPVDQVVCPACLAEVLDPHDRRGDYALTSCCECGPRYSIIRAMPYDRPRTTLADFPLCPECRAEHDAPLERRFHAQPIACPRCGPRVWLADGSGQEIAAESLAVAAVVEHLRFGQIVALKGLGGFQLLVRADATAPVARLRQRKGRPTKPLAIMVPSADQARLVAHMTDKERQLLESPAGPIMLLRRRAGCCVSPVVAPHTDRLGVLLPTTPLHHLLLRACDFPVVATSGNVSDEPIEIDEVEALDRLRGIADVFLLHNRPIARRVDDSVIRLVAGAPLLLRAAGVTLPCRCRRWSGWRGGLAVRVPPLLAVGGQQKVALALWTGEQAVLGPHLGDLDSPTTRAAFTRQIDDLQTLYGCTASAVVCDLHPDYASRRWAEASGLPVVTVQHHHAHAAACMVEHDLLDEEVLAFTWDGTGLGSDGTLWGGETLLARLDGFTRVATLRPFVLPGGEAAIRAPGRVALALLLDSLDREAVLADEALLARLGLTPATARTLARMIERGVHCPVTTSIGRLFDAVAALALAIAEVSHEGEAAAWLEAATSDDAEVYPLPAVETGGLLQADWRPLIRRAVEDVRTRVAGGKMAARFHAALAGWVGAVARRHRRVPVLLSGGCFQNARLVEAVERTLAADGCAVYHAGRVPPGDGGLAAGQLAVALAQTTRETAHVPWGAGTAGCAAGRP